MIFRPKDSNDCCCKSWKDKINDLWEKYQGVVKGVKAGAVTAYPDGDGIADLDDAIGDAIAQQVPSMLTDFVTEDDVDAKLEDYVTDAGLAAELTDYATQTDLAAKQDALVSGQTIRTINGRDLLGEGNLQFNDVLPDFSQAEEGDALVIGSEGLPEWGELNSGWELMSRNEDSTVLAHNNVSHILNGSDFTKDPSKDYLVVPRYFINASGVAQNGSYFAVQPICYPSSNTNTEFTARICNNSTVNAKLIYDLYAKDGDGHVSMISYGTAPIGIPSDKRGEVPVCMGEYIAFDGYVAPKKPTSTDVNKVLVAKSTSIVTGYLEWREIIPAYSAADAGKVLSVNSSGELEWITLP